jgi:hypothetical protein
MNMTDILTMCAQFQAVHGWRYRYVNRTWWVWDGEQWSHLDALPRMQQALVGLARDMFPTGHKAADQLQHGYMLRNMELRLRQHCRADTLLSDPRPGPGSRSQ